MEKKAEKLSRRKALLNLGAAGLGIGASLLFGKSWTGSPVARAESAEGTVLHVTIQDLRGMSASPPNTVYYVTNVGQEGFFQHDARDKTSADNGGTVIVSASGLRFERIIEDSLLNVKWFGATGSGSVDDTAAIQRCIDAAMQSGGNTVLIPRGLYVISSALRIYPYTVLTGVGAVSSQIVNKGADYAIRAANENDFTRSARISNLRITGSETNAGGIFAQNFHSCTFDNIQFTFVPRVALFFYGNMSACHWNNVIQCQFIGNATSTHAIRFSQNTGVNSPNANKIHQCIISGGNIGIEIVSSGTLVISETGISDTAGYWLVNGGKYNRFIANRYENSAASGGGVYFTPASSYNVQIGETYAGGNPNTRMVDEGINNAKLNTIDPVTTHTELISVIASELKASTLSATRFFFSPANNSLDSIEVTPHASFGGQIMRIYTDETKAQLTYSLNKQGSIVSKGSLDMGEGLYMRVPNVSSPPRAPAKGTIYFDTKANKLKVWTGSVWETITST